MQMNVLKLFGNQIKEMHRTDKEVTYLLKHKDGQITVHAIKHWKLMHLIHEYKYDTKVQKEHKLPIFVER